MDAYLLPLVSELTSQSLKLGLFRAQIQVLRKGNRPRKLAKLPDGGEGNLNQVQHAVCLAGFNCAEVSGETHSPHVVERDQERVERGVDGFAFEGGKLVHPHVAHVACISFVRG
jgi:hypothetical protein